MASARAHQPQLHECSSDTVSDSSDGMDLMGRGAEDEYDSDTSGSGSTISEVQVDFGVYDPAEKDWGAVRHLLSRMLPPDDELWAPGALADIVTAQASVGSLVKVENSADDDAVYGLVTAMPWQPYSENEGLVALVSFMLRKAHKYASKSALRTLQHVFKGKLGKAGVLLNERVLNLPPELAPALHNAVLEDIAWAQHNEIDDEHRARFQLDMLVLLCPRFMAAADESADGSAARAGHKRARSDKPGSGSSIDSYAWLHYEEESLAAVADASFSFPWPLVAGEGDAAQVAAATAQDGIRRSPGVPQARTVLIVPMAKYREAVRALQSGLSAL